MYLVEKTVIASGFVTSLISLWFIPRRKIAPASFIFLAAQLFTWILGLFAAEFDFLDYPVHELSKASSTSFSFEFFDLPIFTIHFIFHYPYEKPFKLRVLYYIVVSSVFSFGEYLLEKYTLVIEYHEWRWYWTWISLTMIFYIVMVIYRWFYKMKNIFAI